MIAGATIVRILAVRDTRQREEIGDRFVPIPGSGNIRACDRCDREHEIHVDVELSDGRAAVIGQGCAKGESMEVQARLKSAISAALTCAKLAAELVRARAALEIAEQVRAAVQALPLPGEPVLVEEIPDEHGRGLRRVYALGDATVWTLPGASLDDERRRALIDAWRARRYRDAGQVRDVWQLRSDAADIEKRLARVERKLAGLTGA